MGRTTRKRSLSSESQDNCKSDSASDSESEGNKADDKKRMKRGDDREWNGSESEQLEQSSAKVKSKAKKPTKDSSTTVKKKPSDYVRRPKKGRWGKTLEIESIVTYSVAANLRKYKVKLKDESTMWVTSQMLRGIRPDLFRQYNEDIENGTAVEGIVGHEKQKNHSTKFLLKWSDESKGESWETKETARKWCPNLLKQYIANKEKEEADANAVTAILAHKLVHHKSKYLIKWKDATKGETWETARRTIALCPNILDKFTMKNPDCVPTLYEKESVEKPGMSRLRAQVKFRNKYDRVTADLLDDFDDDVDWEVERIVDICNKRDKTREFLVRWKGFRSAYDSWLPESDLDCPELLEQFMKMKAKRDEERALLQYKNGKLRKVEKRRGQPRQKPKDRLATTGKAKPKVRRATTSKAKGRLAVTNKAKPKSRLATKGLPKSRLAT